MSFPNLYDMYNDPVLILFRKGDISDPYVDITEDLKIVNNRTITSEIPVEFNHITISGYTEIYSGSPNSTQFIVNYSNGVVTFNESEEGKTLSLTYKGRGKILYPAERIYTHNENPDIIRNLQDIIDSGDIAIEALEKLENFQFLGAYNNSTQYFVYNNVEYNGNTYICIKNSLGNLPTDDTYWKLLSSKGEQGMQGEQGEQGIQGEQGLFWQGTYSELTTYYIDDAVQYNGSSYICILESTGNIPTNTTYWDLLAQKGIDGAGAGDMLKSIYDQNDDGVVDSAEKIQGVNLVGNSKYYGTDSEGNVGFHNVSGGTAGDITYDNTTSGLIAENVQDAIGELDENIGDTATLTTTDKSSVVNAVNEVNEDVATHLADYASLFTTNADAKNSIYRGKYLGSSVTPEQYTAISSGAFTDLYIGDYWTIGGVNWRIAAFNYYRNTGDSLVPGNHITIVPDTQLYTHAMNDTNITTGGYIGSKMYIEGLEQAKTTIRGIFGTHLVKHRQIYSNATTDGKASGWAWVDSEVDLMSEIMVYGSIVWGESTIGGSGYNIGVGKSQLPLFALNPRMINTRQNYWLRDVVSATGFAYVRSNGSARANSASTATGVRPAFSIS